MCTHLRVSVCVCVCLCYSCIDTCINLLQADRDTSFGLNESILHGGPPAKKLKAEVLAPTSTKPHPQQHHHGNRSMYSIDDVLNAPSTNSSFMSTSYQPRLVGDKPRRVEGHTVDKGEHQGGARGQAVEFRGREKKKTKHCQV